ncbi:hypothetical protein GH714_038649 [Hevea brasiliensis]|uniref:Omega-hydroxypalmitate O-feruloyl transferase n=1 Tax=Hevea brasiliensis TaxID=3981 RepID=A0A6A6N922_HEVBR|nr:hypothetical protein GH714_038649 [Hevea brasiliensis]
MFNSPELPDCFYHGQPVLISPSIPTGNHSLYLSNLDDQKFLRFSIKYLYLFKKSVSLDILKYSLSKVLVDYYPLAGRLRTSKEDDQKLELTNLRCGGMILCTGINHCLCDGIGTSQFLQAWAHITTKPNLDLPILPLPVHTRYVLKPRNPPQVTFPHPSYVRNAPRKDGEPLGLNHFSQSQPLVPTSLTFTTSHILHLKRQCVPSLKCTTFETLASHTWRSWVRSLDLPSALNVKLLFSVNVRKKLIPEMPQGYYGNGFVLGCAQTFVKDLVSNNLHHGIKLVQQAKSSLSDDYVRSMIDLLEDKTVKTDLSASLVISQWSKLGLEDLEFGEAGKPLHMGPLTSDIYCCFYRLSAMLKRSPCFCRCRRV